MESKTRRTLVKSAPELWALADDLVRMEAWMGDVVGTSQSVSVEVTGRERERMLAWRSCETDTAPASIALELAEKEFGTSVSIVVHHQRPNPRDVHATLEQLLDELGSPERRPFERA
jgi:hypothetical protein